MGARFLNRFCDRPLVCFALIGAFVAALALAGCGRKGPLEPPPAASVAGEQGADANPADHAKADQERLKKKHFVLDPILN
jgi:predicted small lipoprotein YifL